MFALSSTACGRLSGGLVRLGLAGLLLIACKSAEEECEEARVNAERGWQQMIDTHMKAHSASVAAQTEATTRLIRDIEPRLSAAAEQAATQRYDRGTDAWQRAFIASQNALCSAEPECSQIKRENAAAQAAQEELVEKLVSERAALAAVRQAPARMKEAAKQVTPDVKDAALQGAKQASEAAYEACKDITAAPTTPSQQ